jgi:hypothetical protein
MAYGRQPWMDELADFQHVADGSSGRVSRCRHVASGQLIAVKEIPVQLDPSQAPAVIEQLRTLYASTHPNNLGFHGVAYQQLGASSCVVLYTEFMDLGSLQQLYQRFGSLPEPVRLDARAPHILCRTDSRVPSRSSPQMHRPPPIPLAQIVGYVCARTLLGLDYLHKQRHMIHRDVKPSNILVIRRHGKSPISTAWWSRSFGPAPQLRDRAACARLCVVLTRRAALTHTHCAPMCMCARARVGAGRLAHHVAAQHIPLSSLVRPPRSCACCRSTCAARSRSATSA